MTSVCLVATLCISSWLMCAFSNGHVVSYQMKGDNQEDNVPVARVNVDISVEGNCNVTSSGLKFIPTTDRKGEKGEKGEKGGRGPRGRSAPEKECSCDCCQRLNTTEQRLESLTALVKKLENRIDYPTPTVTTSVPGQKTHYRSCQEAKESGMTKSGVYTVNIGDGLDPFEVYCDMVTDGGGWEVFQRRQDGSVDFYLGWSDYVSGFGNLSGEFWLGLDKIHRLTKMHQNLRVDLADFKGRRTYAKYTGFIINDEKSNYSMTLNSYSGDAGDSLTYHRGMQFSTKDRDNDGKTTSTNCAIANRGAWWYRTCYFSNLNGIYFQSPKASGGVTETIVWYTWLGWGIPLKFTEMKLRLA